MKQKRLNRDGWGFQYYPYYQMRIDHSLFHGMACLIRMTDGEANYWKTPKAGRIQVTGSGMTWLELIPDGTDCVITVMYFPDGTHDAERKQYPVPEDPRYQPSVWYVDIIEGIEYDEYGIAVFVDKYLDVIFTPEGDVKIDDRDELDKAYSSGELTKTQYDAALTECDRILRAYCGDIRKTDQWCAQIRRLAEERIAAGEPAKMCKETAVRKSRKDYPTMTHSMQLQPAPFEMIRDGTKTIELRLYDEKRKGIRIGDTISFTNTASKEILKVKVLELYVFDSFETLYRQLPLLDCGYTEDDVDTASPDDMNEYYPEELQQKYGVVGIKVALL